MGKKLAIKGHLTRGKEIIELLEMMGGSECGYCGGGTGLYYYISLFGNIEASCKPYEFDTYIVYTLEEFLEKFPFKVGDKVFLYDNITEGCVTGMEWDENKGTVKYCVYTSAEYWCDVKELLKWNPIDLVEKHYEEQCEEMVKDITLKHLYESGMENIKDEFRKDFCEQCGSQRCSGQDDELEDCKQFKNLMDNLGKPFGKNHKMGPKSKLPSKYYEDRIEEIKSKREYNELRMPLDDDDKLATEVTIMGKRILPPDGYLVGKITQTDNGMLVEYVNKKPVYPKTYSECCEILDVHPSRSVDSTFITDLTDYEDNLSNLMSDLYKLRICRDAYWKIAGEEMGLDEPWKHNYLKDANTIRYAIYNTGDEIVKLDGKLYRNYILCFPTEEMRDAFYENFKDLIEQCKELL